MCEECEFEVLIYEDHQYCSWLVCMVCGVEACDKEVLDTHMKRMHKQLSRLTPRHKKELDI